MNRRGWVALITIVLASCASRVSLDPSDAGSSKDSGNVAADGASSQDATTDSPLGDAGAPGDGAADSGAPGQDSGQPADSGQPPADSGPADSGVQGRCWVNNVGTRKCSQLLQFDVTSPLDGGTSFTVNCLQYQSLCPIGWKCHWLPNNEPGECIP